jgi:kynurenine formamidase
LFFTQDVTVLENLGKHLDKNRVPVHLITGSRIVDQILCSKFFAPFLGSLI